MGMAEAVRYGVPPMVSRLQEAEFRIYPNSGLEIPRLDEAYLGRIVGEPQVEIAKGDISQLVSYLEGRPVGDRFGTDDKQRAKWKKEMYEGHVSNFIPVDRYRDSNQFRANNMYKGMSAIEELSRYAEKESKLNISRELLTMLDELYVKINGKYPNTEKQVCKSYREMKSDEERLGVVRFFEFQFQSVLKMFSFSRDANADF